MIAKHLVLAVLSFSSLAAAQERPRYQTDFLPEELARRRAFLYGFIGDEAIAIVQGAPQAPGFVVFRQSNDFYYAALMKEEGIVQKRPPASR